MRPLERHRWHGPSSSPDVRPVRRSARGTVVAHPISGLLYWSPDLWLDPATAVVARPEEWTYVRDVDQPIMAREFGWLPVIPGEWISERRRSQRPPGLFPRRGEEENPPAPPRCWRPNPINWRFHRYDMTAIRRSFFEGRPAREVWLLAERIPKRTLARWLSGVARRKGYSGPTYAELLSDSVGYVRELFVDEILDPWPDQTRGLRRRRPSPS